MHIECVDLDTPAGIHGYDETVACDGARYDFGPLGQHGGHVSADPASLAAKKTIADSHEHRADGHCRGQAGNQHQTADLAGEFRALFAIGIGIVVGRFGIGHERGSHHKGHD